LFHEIISQEEKNQFRIYVHRPNGTKKVSLQIKSILFRFSIACQNLMLLFVACALFLLVLIFFCWWQQVFGDSMKRNEIKCNVHLRQMEFMFFVTD
jgi:hypothetical protein